MSRDKGNVAEREVAQLARAWWRRLEPDCDFVRTPLSGGWGGPQLRAEFQASGDLMTTAERWPFGVEVKRREGWTEERLRAGKPSPVWEWWLQTQRAATEMRKEPMLWIRKNRQPWRVMLRQAYCRNVGFGWTPDIYFSLEQLAGINYGPRDALPVVYLADHVLAQDPRLFAPPTGSRRRRTA